MDYNADNPDTPKTFVVLESRTHLGGRAETEPERPDIDLGAAFVGPLQSYTMRLIERLGVRLIDNTLPLDLTHVVEYEDGTHHFYQGTSFPQDDFYTQLLRTLYGDANLPFGIADAVATIDRHVLDVRAYLQAPWKMPGAQGIDQLSVKEYMNKLLPSGHLPKPFDPNKILKQFFNSPNLPIDIKVDYTKTPPDVFNPMEMARQLLEISVRSALSSEPEDISALYFLYYVATGGSFGNVMTIGGGADAHRLAFGTRSLVEKLEAAIGPHNVQLGARVTAVRVEQDQPEQVHVDAKITSANGITTKVVTFRARNCIVAMSPPLAAGSRSPIQYHVPDELEPLLKKRIALSDDAVSMGRTIKAS